MNFLQSKGGEGKGGGPGPEARITIFALASAYIIYLGVSILRTTLAGEQEMPLWAAWLAGIGFIAAGGFFLFHYGREYFRARKAAEAEDEEAGAAETAEVEEAGAAEAAEDEEADAKEDEAEAALSDGDDGGEAQG